MSLLAVLVNLALAFGAWAYMSPRIRTSFVTTLGGFPATTHPAVPWIAGLVFGLVTLIPAATLVWAFGVFPGVERFLNTSSTVSLALGVATGVLDGAWHGQRAIRAAQPAGGEAPSV